VHAASIDSGALPSLEWTWLAGTIIPSEAIVAEGCRHDDLDHADVWTNQAHYYTTHTNHTRFRIIKDPSRNHGECSVGRGRGIEWVGGVE